MFVITQLETAKSGSRSLDEQIGFFEGYEYGKNIGLSPNYTTSIDAAMTLIPKYWNHVIHAEWRGTKTDDPRCLYTVDITSPGARYEEVVEQGGKSWSQVSGQNGSAIQKLSLPIAICIAALKARNDLE